MYVPEEVLGDLGDAMPSVGVDKTKGPGVRMQGGVQGRTEQLSPSKGVSISPRIRAHSFPVGVLRR